MKWFPSGSDETGEPRWMGLLLLPPGRVTGARVREDELVITASDLFGEVLFPRGLGAKEELTGGVFPVSMRSEEPAPNGAGLSPMACTLGGLDDDIFGLGVVD